MALIESGSEEGNDCVCSICFSIWNCAEGGIGGDEVEGEEAEEGGGWDVEDDELELPPDLVSAICMEG